MKPAHVMPIVTAILLVVAGTGIGADTVDAQIEGQVTVAVEPASVAVVLGESLDLTVEVTNTGSVATPSLVIHLDITDPNASSSVDPEDWTSTLSQPIGPLHAGETRTLDWRMQPISGGTFAAYVVALAAGVDDIAGSNVITVDVTDRRSLNPNGILPVAISAPTVVGALLAIQVRRNRRTRPHRAASN